MLELAEKKKIELKKLIQKMRDEFSLLIEENKKLAKPLRLLREVNIISSYLNML